MSTILKRSAVKQYALEGSVKIRAGKFSRVGRSFIDRCEARMDAALRSIYRGDLGPTTAFLPEERIWFITPYGKTKAIDQLHLLARDIVFNEVRSHPSIGKTLK